jgi:hypothetical protein
MGKPLAWIAGVITSCLVMVPAPSSATNDGTSQLPSERTQGSVTYLVGGIGHDEVEALRREETQYPLSLEFISRAKPADEYLAGVHVTIRDRQGNTKLAIVADGPIMLARLSAGQYTVSAEFDGQIQTRNIIIAPQKPERVVFEW